jgi:rod shape-determining protein MreD
MFELNPQHVARAGLLTLLVVYVQVSVVSQIALFEVRPELLLALVLAIGIEGGSERGALAGFACGLIFDLFVESPFGLTALVLCILGFLAGNMHGRFFSQPWWFNPALAFVGTAVGAQLWVIVGSVFGQPGLTQATVLKVVIVAGLINAAISPFMVRGVRWALEPQLEGEQR